MAHTLKINDLFWTFQGEGRYTGHRALFIRLPFCNYECPWCDTEYDSYQPWNLEEFKAFITQEKSRFAVITGGEPLANRHLPEILTLLKNESFFISCETNGSFPAPSEIDFVTTSPKKYTKGKWDEYYIHPSIMNKTNEWKYVVDEKFNFEILGRHENQQAPTVFSLSPEYSQMTKNLERIQTYIKEHPKWKISLQTHKWINIP